MTGGNSIANSTNTTRPVVPPKQHYSTDLHERVQTKIQKEHWDETAECHECSIRVPHRLLYVCRNAKCSGFCDPKSEYDTPMEFYEHEKVFCSECAFIGSHKRHTDNLKEAHSFAARVSSTNEQLQSDFKKLAFLNHEQMVDYTITTKFDLDVLPVLPVNDYLEHSTDSADWQQRKQRLIELKETMTQCRLEGAKIAKERADTSLDMYSDLMTTIINTLKEYNKPSRKEEKKRRNTDRTDSSSQSSDCKPNVEDINRDIVLPATTVIEQTPNQPSVPVIDANKANISGGIKQTSDVLPSPDETTAKMISRSLTLRFDQVRDDLSIEKALQDVSDKLTASAGNFEDKMLAARMFKDTNNVALYWPPQ